ncbi:MAG: hypothetical protein RIE53_00250 [Rhodothermales bacterium]
MEGIYESFELLPDGSCVLIRATTSRRTVRYIQDVIGRMEEKLVGRQAGPGVGRPNTAR